ncbi:MAG TPA: exodeoxyribonuclease VII small subunit [Candidatus Omnitrophica bacterium]|nr:MAG: exodeoxyribonuclease VII small subunit [Candidatus Omnitrophota bacterium]RKY34798.1 MAG: exodeoxyribonuclease VII small subunit [Candidatus Omnitrophota bacterium]RKY44913.1 MAG: exodeoxyribonuclease VII small subunit [Candidatus Omnitrophota bacterium]HEC68818.1 exodeoxyribonuclease VII small subunit [Candidatus Omnitrophota bacterium]
MKKEIKFSEAFKELKTIVNFLEEEDLDVEELSAKVERALKLIKICREKIEKTELEVKNILKKFEQEDEKD